MRISGVRSLVMFAVAMASGILVFGQAMAADGNGRMTVEEFREYREAHKMTARDLRPENFFVGSNFSVGRFSGALEDASQDDPGPRAFKINFLAQHFCRLASRDPTPEWRGDVNGVVKRYSGLTCDDYNAGQTMADF